MVGVEWDDKIRIGLGHGPSQFVKHCVLQLLENNLIHIVRPLIIVSSVQAKLEVVDYQALPCPFLAKPVDQCS